MHEYLIADYTDYDRPGDNIPLRIVSLQGLLEEIQKAVEDRLVCIAVYEIREQSFLDFSVPRPPDE